MHSSIVAFPLCRQQKLLRSLTDVFRSKRSEEATLFWRATAKALILNLVERGVDIQSAEDEVRGLLYAVLEEMERFTQARRG